MKMSMRHRMGTASITALILLATLLSSTAISAAVGGTVSMTASIPAISIVRMSPDGSMTFTDNMPDSNGTVIEGKATVVASPDCSQPLSMRLIPR